MFFFHEKVHSPISYSNEQSMMYYNFYFFYTQVNSHKHKDM